MSIETQIKNLMNNEIVIHQVNSTKVQMFEYNPVSQKLSVMFKRGTIYKYNNVPKNVILDLLFVIKNGESVGKFMCQNIERNYEYIRLNNFGQELYVLQ